jgi:C4-dicarboxylate-specific signal transduction histidine kinase
MVQETQSVRTNFEHIKQIVTLQQVYAKAGGIREAVILNELIDDALKMDVGSVANSDVKIVRALESLPIQITTDRHKILQILVNLVRNAKWACLESSSEQKQITISLTQTESHACISVTDNGIGISPENRTRIFSHGFTTRKSGHGFGLHSSALAAKELGGSLTAFSEGLGKGAAFSLELPLEITAKGLSSPDLAIAAASPKS